ncbi:hypothetical protein Gotur_029658 [Gossypium turneri]
MSDDATLLFPMEKLRFDGHHMLTIQLQMQQLPSF